MFENEEDIPSTTPISNPPLTPTPVPSSSPTPVIEEDEDEVNPFIIPQPINKEQEEENKKDINRNNTILFTAEAQAIVDSAPDLRTAQNLLQKAYVEGTWDSPDEVAKEMGEYSKQLRYLFKDQGIYSQADTYELAPISTSDFNNPDISDAENISNWEEANLKELAETKDPDALIIQDKLQKSIEAHASNLRRNITGKDAGFFKDSFYRAAAGAIGGPAQLLGLTNAQKALMERTNPENDEGFMGMLAEGVGFVGGIGVSALGGPVGVGTYLAASGAGAVRGAYEKSLEATGEEGRAAEAAVIEAGSQTLQTLAGAKVFGKPLTKLAGKVLGKELVEEGVEAVGKSALRQAGGSALLEGSTEATGQFISNIGENYGANDWQKSLYAGTIESFGVGALLGGGVDYMATKLANKRPEPLTLTNDAPRVRNTDEHTVNPPTSPQDGFTYTAATPNGTVYASTDGKTAYKTTNNQTSDIYDQTFFVSPEVAQNLKSLETEENPDNTNLGIYTDGNSLRVSSGWVNEEGLIGNDYYDRDNVGIKAETQPQPGLVAVRVNTIKDVDGKNAQFRYEIGEEPIENVEIKPIVEEEDTVPPIPIGSDMVGMGAAHIGTHQERQIKRIRAGNIFAKTFGNLTDEDTDILGRYTPRNNAADKKAGYDYVNQHGIVNAYNAVLAYYDSGLVFPVEVAKVADAALDKLGGAITIATSEGNLEAAEKFQKMALELAPAVSGRRREGGQLSQSAASIDYESPGFRIANNLFETTKRSIDEVAQEEGISYEEAAQTDTNLVQTQEAIQAELQNQQKEVESATQPYDQEIVETQNDIDQIENEAQENYDNYIEALESRIEEFQAQIDRLQLEDDQRVQKAKDALTKAHEKSNQLQTEIASLTQRVEELEQLGLQQAPEKKKARAAEVAKEAAAEKNTNRRKAMERAVEKYNEKEITPEDGLDTEQRSALSEMKKDLKAKSKEKEKIDSDVANAAEPESLRKNEDKIAKKKEKAAKDKEEISKQTPESFLTERKKEQLKLLKKHLRANERSKSKAVSDAKKNTSEQSARLKALREKEARLKRTKEKLDKKKRENLQKLSKTNEKIAKLLQQSKNTKNAVNKATLLKKVLEIESEELPNSTLAKGDVLQSIWKLSILSGIGTQVSNVKGNATMSLLQGLALSLGNRKIGKAFRQAAWQAIKSGEAWTGAKVKFKGGDVFRGVGTMEGSNASELAESFASYKTESILGREHRDFLKDPLTRKDFEFLSEVPGFGPVLDFLSNEGSAVTRPLGKIVNQLAWVGRLMSGMDTFAYITNREGQAAAMLMQEAVQKKLDKQSAASYIAERMFNSTEEFDKAYANAKKEADELKSEGIILTPSEIRQRAYEDVEAQRDIRIRKGSDIAAARISLTSRPTGAIGGLIDGIEQTLKGSSVEWVGSSGKQFLVQPFNYMLPFLNVAGNLANEMLNYTVVPALYRAKVDPHLRKFRTELQRAQNTLTNLENTPNTPIEKIQKARDKVAKQQKILEEQTSYQSLNSTEHIGKAMTGAVLLGSTAALFLSFQPDDENFFEIYGAGPASPDKKKTWKEAGGKPYTIKINGKSFTYGDTGLGMVLAFLGIIRDKQRWTKDFTDQDTSEALLTMATAFTGAFTEQTFLKNLGEFVGNLQGEIYGQENAVGVAQNIGLNIGKGFIPFSGLLKDISAMIDKPIETRQNFMAKLFQGIPLAQSIAGKPALNAFGEPVERTWTDRIRFVGRFMNDRTMEPNWRWLAANGYHIPRFNKELGAIAKEGSYIHETRSQKLGRIAAGVLQPEELHDAIKTAGPEVKDIVARYRELYGNSGYSKDRQDEMSKEISAVYNRARKEIAFR